MAERAGATAAAEVMRQLLPRQDEIAELMTEHTLAAMPDHAHDAALVELLRASITDNLVSGMHGIAGGLDIGGLDAPPAALEYARRLAQRDIPMSQLLRAYRLGQSQFLRVVGEHLTAEDRADSARTMVDLVNQLSGYVDHVSEHVARAYERERELWVGSKAGLRQQAVARLMAGEPIELAAVEHELDYRFDGWHLALAAWVDETVAGADVVGTIGRLGSALTRMLPAVQDVLTVPVDAFGGRAWLRAPDRDGLDPARLAAGILATGLPVHVVLGPPRPGLAGFRASSIAARRVQAIARALPDRATPSVLGHDEVAAITLLTEDPDELAGFVHETLGDLAYDDERSAGLRESLRVFLECNRSYAGAAQRLFVHRNTVHYRVQQAVGVLGHELPADVLRLHLALETTRWLGSRVLRGLGTTGT